jgi:hypothetical protein
MTTMAANKDLHRQWARAGAAARVGELKSELAEIYRAFPELSRGGGTAPATAGGRGSGGPAAGKKRKFSARGKKAISDGMRKYWARRKALAAKAEKAAK